MLFYPPFNMPFFYNNRYPRNPTNTYFCNHENTNPPNFKKEPIKEKNDQKEKASVHSETAEAFFEIFGLKLYFDDILIMCILFFLYTEKVKDEELFICLILLLLT